MTNEQLENLEKDLQTLINDNFHARTKDLQNIVFNEDIKELIKFVKKVNDAFKADQKMIGVDSYWRGYIDSYNAIKREIYEFQPKKI